MSAVDLGGSAVGSPMATTLGSLPSNEVTPQPSVGSVKALFDAMDSYPPSGNHEAKEARMVPNMFSSYDEMNNAKDKTELIPTTLYPGLTMAQLWATAFASSSPFWRNYKEKREDSKMELPEWNISPCKSYGSRMYTCYALVEGNPTPFFEAGRFAMARDLKEGSTKMSMHLSAQTPEVICGTTFRVEAILNFAETKDGVTVRILGGCRKMAGRFSFIKGLAEPRACSEMKKGYVTCLGMLKDALPPPPAGTPAVEMPTIVESQAEATAETRSKFPSGGSGGGGGGGVMDMLMKPEVLGGLGGVFLISVFVYFFFIAHHRGQQGGGSGAYYATGNPSFGGGGGPGEGLGGEDRMIAELLGALTGGNNHNNNQHHQQQHQQHPHSGHGANSSPHSSSSSSSSHPVDHSGHDHHGGGDHSSGHGSNGNGGNLDVLYYRTHLLEDKVASLEMKLTIQYIVILLVAGVALWAKFG